MGKKMQYERHANDIVGSCTMYAQQ
jgi:hypothetical protein